MLLAICSQFFSLPLGNRTRSLTLTMKSLHENICRKRKKEKESEAKQSKGAACQSQICSSDSVTRGALTWAGGVTLSDATADADSSGRRQAACAEGRRGTGYGAPRGTARRGPQRGAGARARDHRGATPARGRRGSAGTRHVGRALREPRGARARGTHTSRGLLFP